MSNIALHIVLLVHITKLSGEVYRKISKPHLKGNKIVNHSDVVGASPVGAAPTTS